MTCHAYYADRSCGDRNCAQQPGNHHLPGAVPGHGGVRRRDGHANRTNIARITAGAARLVRDGNHPVRLLCLQFVGLGAGRAGLSALHHLHRPLSDRRDR